MSQAAVEQPASVGRSVTEAEALAAVATLIATQAPISGWVRTVAQTLQKIGLPRSAVAPAVRLAMSQPIWPDATTIRKGPAVQASIEAEAFFRAGFVVESARRRIRARRAGTPPDKIEAAEKRYYESHMAAQSNRRAAALAVDREARRLNTTTLGWYAVRDTRTTAECRAAHGRNFEVGQRPRIGYPGTVHPHCRCKAGPAHRSGGAVDAAPRRRAAS